MARPEGFEPPISGIGIRCVIQLRHGRIFVLYLFSFPNAIKNYRISIFLFRCIHAFDILLTIAIIIQNSRKAKIYFCISESNNAKISSYFAIKLGILFCKEFRMCKPQNYKFFDRSEKFDLYAWKGNKA